MKHKVNDITFFGGFAEVAKSISEDEWMFYDYIDDLSEQINSAMEAQGVTKTELAKRLGVTKPFVSKVLNGSSNNITMKTFCRIVYALNSKPLTKIVPNEEKATWYCAFKGHGDKRSKQCTVHPVLVDSFNYKYSEDLPVREDDAKLIA